MIRLAQHLLNLLPRNEKNLLNAVSEVKFFSIQADGTTDKET